MKRLTPALLTMIMLGVVGLLVALYFGKKLFATADTGPVDELINIPMALTDLEPGTLITEAHVGLGKAYSSNISRDVVRNNRVLVGRVVKTEIEAAQPISTFDLYPVGQGPAPSIAEGMRAVTIPVTDTSGLNTVIKPDSYVDVHFTPSSIPAHLDRGGLTMTLFKGVRVEAINGSTVSAANTSGTQDITLELTPEQANIILLAKDKGELNLVYTPEGRGMGTIALSDSDRATLDQILGLEEPELPEDEDPPFVTETYTGAGRRMHTFRDGLRTDRYAIERYDYNRANRGYGRGYGYGGWGGGYGGWGSDVPMPDFEYFGNNGGYFSVPPGGAGDAGNNGNNGNNGGNANLNGNGGNFGGFNGFGQGREG